MDSSIFAISVTTFACSLLSLLGSILVLLSYVIASTNSKPKAAQLIRNLALADFFWFLSSLIQATYWLFTTKNVPTVLCFVCSPIVIFTRMASLIWTCAISFDVLMSVNKRKWRTQGEGEYNLILKEYIYIFIFPILCKTFYFIHCVENLNHHVYYF